jgi:L-alanine-DL-glutamate epimerase-like enolase superfamily enzyme
MMELSDLVAGTNIRLSLEVSSTAVATLAACHYAAADSQVAHVEFHHVHQVFFDELELHLIPDSNGQFTLPTTPGLGMSLPLDKVVEELSLDRSTI